MQNDPTGYWAAIARQNASAGLSSVLPVGTVFRADLAVRTRLLAAQIAWIPTLTRWMDGKLQVVCSLQDDQFSSQLVDGGADAQASVTLVALKSDFGGQLPVTDVQFQVELFNTWKWFGVVSVAGLIDQKDDLLSIVAAPIDAIL